MRRVGYGVYPILTAYNRPYHLPGWKTRVSTKDARTREQRETDRKARQIEKLPRPQALHDFQYPYEKTVLSDAMFQYPVYENELDTPHLFNLTPPPDFFIYWNVGDFERTSYPPLPDEDHRFLVPNMDTLAWKKHRERSLKYLRKHEIMPHYLPHVSQDVNLSVVFPGTYATRARRCEETGQPLPPPPPVTELNPRNFWMTAHCGNYIELTDLQHPPSIYFFEKQAGDRSVEGNTNSAEWYTLIIASPDYPYRVPVNVDGRTKNGFFINYMVTNLPGSGNGLRPSVVNGIVTNTSGINKKGDVVVPYVAPLPTEDAGTTRHICMLFKQSGHVSDVSTVYGDTDAGFAARCSFHLHASSRDSSSTLEDATLRNVESVLPPDPCAVTFFQTKWDIQVQEFYESRGLLEPAAPPNEEVEAILAYHAKEPSQLRVRARHRPDGATNIGDDPNFWGQSQPTSMMEGSMQSLWSRRTAVGKNGVLVTYRK
ncbi:uncharacterized protein TM35_000171720 [Trypanosoma theileri]|uniref:Phosphatidylethanolamine-binding protein n=1 Tax=Trypanosoma theileri TaxID=67003 RepID=A0A1X0NW02_9TRYP|nr:uncharacterized protein TM35_000171720 [Trypanosoma theileri]ORC88300.1 hypothetical protein TM35_000171720 [Trypanosoma theileri]